MAGQLIIKQGKEKALLRKHPWVFTGAVAKIKGKPGLGDTVDVLDSKGQFLGRAAYSPHSQICERKACFKLLQLYRRFWFICGKRWCALRT